MGYRNQFLYFMIGTHLCIIMIQIYMYSTHLHYTYAIQKEERIQEQLQRTVQEYEQKVKAVQSLKVIKEKAVTELCMEPLSLSKIHTIKQT
jgi:cell division protein FtsL